MTDNSALFVHYLLFVLQMWMSVHLIHVRTVLLVKTYLTSMCVSVDQVSPVHYVKQVSTVDVCHVDSHCGASLLPITLLQHRKLIIGVTPSICLSSHQPLTWSPLSSADSVWLPLCWNLWYQLNYIYFFALINVCLSNCCCWRRHWSCS